MESGGPRRNPAGQEREEKKKEKERREEKEREEKKEVHGVC